jgi:hypothetical protein
VLTISSLQAIEGGGGNKPDTFLLIDMLVRETKFVGNLEEILNKTRISNNSQRVQFSNHAKAEIFLVNMDILYMRNELKFRNHTRKGCALRRRIEEYE